MYCFYDNYIDRVTNENVSHLKTDGHLNSRMVNSRITNSHLESSVSKLEMTKDHLSRRDSLENNEKHRTMISDMNSDPVIFCPPEEETQLSLAEVKTSSNGEAGARRDNVTTDASVQMLETLKFEVEESVSNDIEENSSTESEIDSVVFDWPRKTSSTKLKLPSTPAIARRHSVSVTSSVEIRAAAVMLSGFPRHRQQRRRSIVWADETKMCSLETVHFIAKRSTSTDQISLLVNWFREKCNSVSK